MAPRLTGRSSAKLQHTPTSAEAFALVGPSELPDPQFNAYRKDLADVALAGRVIASHYAEPRNLKIIQAIALRAAGSEEAAVIGHVRPGEIFGMLDDSRGWAWGYAGEDRRVGYLLSSALAEQSD